MNTIKERKNRDLKIILVRTFLTAMIYLNLFLLTISIQFPTVLGLGEVRVLTIAVITRILEEVLFNVIKASIVLKTSLDSTKSGLE